MSAPDLTALEERIRTAELVNEFAQRIAQARELGPLIQSAIARTRELCGAQGASLLLVDAQTGELVFNAVDGGGGNAITPVRLSRGAGVAGKVATSATALLVRDVRDEPAFDPRCDDQSGFSTGSLLALPLIFGGDVIGVLEAVRDRSHPPFDPIHLERLERLAPHITIALHNATVTTHLHEAQELVLQANAALERKVEERTRQIAQAKREWEMSFDAIREPLAVLEGFVIRRANTAYAERAGVSVKALPGSLCHQVLAGRSTPCPSCPRIQGEGSARSAEVPLEGRSYRVFSFEMAHATGESAAVTHYRDITEQKSLETKLRESERLRAVGQLASGAAHEINNPLGFLVSNLQSLRLNLAEADPAGDDSWDAALHGESVEMVNDALQGAGRVERIVRALRELSRLRIGHREATSASDAVTRTVRAELTGHPHTEIELDPQARVLIDPLQLDQALGQVLRNARQATSPSQRISVRTLSREGEVRIEVRDEGCGIAPEHLPKVFEPFFTTRGVGGGIGLGLTAAYGIVNQNDGRIEIASTVGKGSTVTLVFPLPLPAHPAPLPAEIPHAEP